MKKNDDGEMKKMIQESNIIKTMMLMSLNRVKDKFYDDLFCSHK